MTSLTIRDAVDSIDIDIGGTFTDLVLTFNGERHIAKCPTTPHDLSVGFLNAIEAAGEKVGLTTEELLPKIDIMRYSTTVALNRLLQRKGPRIGLLTTEGHEDVILIGRGAQWTDGKRVTERRNIAIQTKPLPLVDRSLTLGVRERIDSAGQIVRPLDEEDVRQKLRTLMERGARAIVVSLLWSFANPIHEQRVREIIREEYKEYHIGFLPVVLSSAVVSKSGEYERTMTAVLDAYLQRSMQNDIGATWDKLRESGYRGAFLMITTRVAAPTSSRRPLHARSTAAQSQASWALPISPSGLATAMWLPPTWAAPASMSRWWSSQVCATTTSSR